MEQSSLSKKMGIKPGSSIHLIDAPEGFESEIAPLPLESRFADAAAQESDTVMLFCRSKADLDRGLEPALERLTEGGFIWVAYLKGKAKPPRDLTRDIGWESLDGKGLDGVNLISLNDAWSAFKFRVTGREQPTDSEMLEALLSGPRAASRPNLERLATAILALGPDIAANQRKSYLAFVRRKQFAALVPAREGAVELGLKLKSTPSSPRLQPADNVGGGSITHRISVAADADLDSELSGWLKEAYDSAG